MKKPIEDRQTVILSFLAGEITKLKAAEVLGCTTRTIENYRIAYKAKGLEGIKDHRKSNYFKLSSKQKEKIIQLKKKDRWRSARNIRDHLKLSVSEQHIQRLIVAAGLSRENLKRVKAIQRFEAAAPNDLWQTDIMGKIAFSNLGILYLIATLDDHSRFVPAGRWFKTQGKMNVF
jgi:transposase